MQPKRRGVALRYWLGCIVLCLAAQESRGQKAIEAQQQVVDTQQQVNEKIRALSAESAKAPGSSDYVIGRGDVVSMEVFDIPELTRDMRVSLTGSIGVPLVPVRLYVAGLTEVQVQQKITEVLEAR